MIKIPVVLYKILVIGIIILFIGAVITPTIASDIATSATLDNDGSLLGYVNDTSGNPIEGALVRVHFHGTYRVDYSDSMGFYHVTNIPICYCLKNATCSKECYKKEWVLLGIAENTSYDFILTSNIPPVIPIIDGPTFGEVEVEYNYTFVSVDMDGDDIFYWIDWGDDNNTSWIGPYPTDVEIYRSHSWSENGTYEIRAKAKDFCCESDWSFKIVMIGEYHLPTPTIDGPTDGKVGVEYEFTFNSTDNGGDPFIYLVNWDDGSPIEIVYPTWPNPEGPGEGIANHSWDTKGTYIISARTRDIHNAYSEWGILEVTMPKNKPFNFNFDLLSWFFERFPLLEVIILRAMNLLR